MLPPCAVKDGTAPWFESELLVVTPDELGLKPSAELLLGGVSRFPTLVKVVAGAGCDAFKYECLPVDTKVGCGGGGS